MTDDTSGPYLHRHFTKLHMHSLEKVQRATFVLFVLFILMGQKIFVDIGRWSVTLIFGLLTKSGRRNRHKRTAVKICKNTLAGGCLHTV